MTTAWLVLTAAILAASWFAIWARRPSVWRGMSVAAVPVAALAAWLALQAPLGLPATGLPLGEYMVLGARIDVPTDTDGGAIYVLVDGAEPFYVRLPYSKANAEKLQEALNAGNGVRLAAEDGDTGTEYDFSEPPQADDEQKQAERPIIGGGNG